jgi:hypothetical protein
MRGVAGDEIEMSRDEILFQPLHDVDEPSPAGKHVGVPVQVNKGFRQHIVPVRVDVPVVEDIPSQSLSVLGRPFPHALVQDRERLLDRRKIVLSFGLEGFQDDLEPGGGDGFWSLRVTPGVRRVDWTRGC